MRRALDKMERILHRVDMIVEVRDARIPLSSNNDRFEELLARKQRILLFNKKDLAEESTNKVSRTICNLFGIEACTSGKRNTILGD